LPERALTATARSNSALIAWMNALRSSWPRAAIVDVVSRQFIFEVNVARDLIGTMTREQMRRAANSRPSLGA
jgi:hypothetical protein